MADGSDLGIKNCADAAGYLHNLHFRCLDRKTGEPRQALIGLSPMDAAAIKRCAEMLDFITTYGGDHAAKAKAVAARKRGQSGSKGGR